MWYDSLYRFYSGREIPLYFVQIGENRPPSHVTQGIAFDIFNVLCDVQLYLGVKKWCFLMCLCILILNQNLMIKHFGAYTDMKITRKLLSAIFEYRSLTGEITHKHKPRMMFSSEAVYKSVNKRLEGTQATIKRNEGRLYCLVGKKPVRAVTVALACMGIDENDVLSVRYVDGNDKNLAWDNINARLKTDDTKLAVTVSDDAQVTINAVSKFTNVREAERVQRKIELLLKQYGFKGIGNE